jgi:hypothetical protein
MSKVLRLFDKLTAQHDNMKMKSDWIQLYGRMKTEMWLCRQKLLLPVEEIERCFQIAEKYRMELLSAITNYEFESEKEEIYFFKNMKPLFNAEIDLLGLLNYVAIFKNSIAQDNTDGLEKFYKKELLRNEKFRSENPGFCDYVSNRRTENDKEWFTRNDEDLNIQVRRRISSKCDGLMGTWLALERYVEIITRELENLCRARRGEALLPPDEFKW